MLRVDSGPRSDPSDGVGPRPKDLAVAGLAAAVQLIGTHFARLHQTGFRSLDIGAYLLLLIGPLALLGRRRYTVAVLAAVWSVTMAYLAIGYPAGPIWISLIIAFVTAVLGGHRRAATVSLVTGFVASGWLGPLLGTGPPPTLVGALGVRNDATSQPPRLALTSLAMAPRKKPPTPKGRRADNPAAQGGGRRKRPNRRKIVALGILIILPLVIIGGVLGSIGSGARSTTSSGTSAAPGIDLIVQACLGMSTLAQNAGALTGTTSTTKGAGPSPTAGAGPTTSSTDAAAAASNLLTQMKQIAQLAANAAGTNSAWQPMATDINKLNDMVQADSGDSASFSSQLAVVAQECSAVVGSNPSTPTSG